MALTRARIYWGDMLHSHPQRDYSPSGFVAIGDEDPQWPCQNVNNGVAGSYARILSGDSAAFGLYADRRIAPRRVVLYNNNFEGATSVRLQGSNSPDFSTLTHDQDLTSGMERYFWADMFVTLPFPITGLEFWRVKVDGLDKPAVLGEFVLLGTTGTINAQFQWGYSEDEGYITREAGVTPLGIRHRTPYGAKRRELSKIMFAGVDSNAQALRDALDYAARGRWPLVFFPNDPDDASEVYLLDHDGQVEEEFDLETYRRLSMTFRIQVGGRLT